MVINSVLTQNEELQLIPVSSLDKYCFCRIYIHTSASSFWDVVRWYIKIINNLLWIKCQECYSGIKIMSKSHTKNYGKILKTSSNFWDILLLS